MTHDFKAAYELINPYISAEKLDPIGVMQLGGITLNFKAVPEALRIMSQVQEGKLAVVPVEDEKEIKRSIAYAVNVMCIDNETNTPDYVLADNIYMRMKEEYPRWKKEVNKITAAPKAGE